MESRRLVVWISAGILGFQGATLAFDLLNCTVLSWLYVRQHGLGVVRQEAGPRAGELVAGVTLAPGGGGDPGPERPVLEQEPAGGLELDADGPRPLGPAGTQAALQGPSQPRHGGQAPAPQGPAPPVVGAFDPTGVFCAQPRSRIDDAVSQGLTILAGLALGSSVGGGGKGADGGP